MVELARRAVDWWRQSGRLLCAPATALPGERFLSGWSGDHGDVTVLELSAGEGSVPQGPYVRVRTALTGADLRGEILPDLEEMLEDERGRLFEQTGLDEGEGPCTVREQELTLSVDGVPRPARVRVEEPAEGEGAVLWGARLTVHREDAALDVTVVVRGLPVGELGLELTADPAPYLDGYGRSLVAMRERLSVRVPLGEAEVPPVQGLEAHRELALAHMVETRLLREQVREGRTAGTPRRLRGNDRALRWEAVVRQQMRLAAESRTEADAAVTSMVNQLVWLAEEVDWVVDTEEGRQAVEETVRHTVFASEVRSLPAQLTWQALWTACSSGPTDLAEASPPYPADRSGTWEDLQTRWLAAWETWRLQRNGR
jgi:hypothetical protein